MASKKNNSFRGTTTRQELAGQSDLRDTRTALEKFKDTLLTPNGAYMMGFLIIGCMWIFPMSINFAFIVGMLLFRWISKNEFTLPFRMPKTSGLLDPNDPKPGTDDVPGKAAGIAFLGNERGTNKELWFSASDMKTHLLVFGSTGAGKALRNDELVHTPQGWKKNIDLKVGELISTPNGKSSEIIGIYPQGEKTLYKLQFEDGRTIKVTEDHLWEIYDSIDIEEESEYVGNVVSTLEIQNKLYQNNKLYIPMTKTVDNEDVKLLLSIDKIVDLAIESLETAGSVTSLAKLCAGSASQRTEFWELFLSKLLEREEFFQSSGTALSIGFKNSKVAKEIQFLTRSLGYYAIIEEIESDEKTYFDREVVAILTLKKQAYLKIVDVSRTDEREECQCIKIANKDGLFVTRDWIVTHNTETLISLAFNTLVQGSGFIYVDGKGDNSLWAKIFSMCRSVGREDDILVLNYMTGGRDVFGAQENKLSNTLNPFISGSAAGLTELLVGLMDDAGGDNAMWKGRAISLISGIMLALVWLRDNKGLLLDVDQIRKYLLLDEIQVLSKRKDLPPHVIEAIEAYLVSLPGYNAKSPKQSETVNDQHGYLQMQFTKILGSLSDTYGYIFRTNLGEIDFFDVVVNRRILVVLLPALEKSIDELGNLGKIVVACLKSMMATGLGDKLEGLVADVIDTKPTTAPAPYMCILDEYGYYVVKGAAVMPAQARSLGFSMVFAGQDYPAFKKNNNAEEAVSTIGNCNIKIFMKVEDPTDTFDLFKQSVGQALVFKSSGSELDTSGLLSNYKDDKRGTTETRDRGHLLDLKDQREGEAHIIFKSTLVRAKMFYAQPDQVKKLQLNHFLKVEPPTKKEIEDFEDSANELIEHLKDDVFMSDLTEEFESGKDIERIQALFNYGKENGLSLEKNAAGILAVFSKITFNGLGQFKDSLEHFADGIDETPSSASIFSKSDDEMSYEEHARISPMDEDDMEDDLPPFLEEDKARNSFEDISRNMGYDEETSRKQANEVIEDMRKASEYPRSTPPEESTSTDNILKIIQTLEDELNN